MWEGLQICKAGWIYPNFEILSPEVYLKSTNWWFYRGGRAWGPVRNGYRSAQTLKTSSKAGSIRHLLSIRFAMYSWNNPGQCNGSPQSLNQTIWPSASPKWLLEELLCPLRVMIKSTV
jgi:hypothetical protein